LRLKVKVDIVIQRCSVAPLSCQPVVAVLVVFSLLFRPAGSSLVLSTLLKMAPRKSALFVFLTHPREFRTFFSRHHGFPSRAFFKKKLEFRDGREIWSVQRFIRSLPLAKMCYQNLICIICAYKSNYLYKLVTIFSFAKFYVVCFDRF